MKKLKWFICFLILSIALAGCGTSAGKGTLKVGVRSDIVGFGYLNPTTNEYYGLEIDLAKELATRLGYSGVEFMTVTPDDRKETLLQGNVDCLIATYSIAASRLKNFDFSPSYYMDNTSVMVEDSSMIQTLEDLVGKNVGVMEGTDAAPKISAKMIELGLISEADLKGTSLTYKADYQELSDALETGEVDAACMDGVIANAYMKDDRRVLEETVGDSDYGVATQKGSELSAEVAQAIQNMLDDGTIAGLIDKWD